MHISPALAQKTRVQLSTWRADATSQSHAIDSFIGDIYSGLRPDTLTEADRIYADSCLYILSGLYGALRPFDGVMPYRLEMGYKFPDEPYKNLYDFWGDSVSNILADDSVVINLAAVEYSRVVVSYLKNRTVITPKFLTVNKQTGEAGFVVVHAKIARGAFARWLITSRVTTLDRLREFTELGYEYDPVQSMSDQPVFVCKEFGGLGLSMRLIDRKAS